MSRTPRPRSQAPFRFWYGTNRRSRTPWRRVTFVERDTYRVDGIAEVFECPVDAIHIAESIGAVAYRNSDGRPLNYYGDFVVEGPEKTP